MDDDLRVRVEISAIDDWDEAHLRKAYELTTWNVARLLALPDDTPTRAYELDVCRRSAERYGVELVRRGLI